MERRRAPAGRRLPGRAPPPAGRSVARLVLSVAGDAGVVEAAEGEVDTLLPVADLHGVRLVQELEVASNLGAVRLVGDERTADLGVAAPAETHAHVPAGDDHDPVPGELARLEEREVRFLDDQDPVAGDSLAPAH